MPLFATLDGVWVVIRATCRLVPNEDRLDLFNGAAYIPPQVTDARRKGSIVEFVRDGAQKDWYWSLPDGTRVPHGEIS